MTPFNRRRFLEYLGSAAATTAFMDSIARARAMPAHSPTGTIDDVEHIVVPDAGKPRVRSLLRHAARRARLRRPAPGDAALRQARVVPAERRRLRAAVPSDRADDLGMQFLDDTPHGWTDTQAAWNGGKYDQWIPNKGRRPWRTTRARTFRSTTRSPTRSRSATPTTARSSARPIRTAITCGPAGSATTARAAARSSTTPKRATTGRRIPERLERAGISWKIYQDSGVGPRRRRLLGLDRRPVHRQLRRQLAAVLPPVPERAARAARCTRGARAARTSPRPARRSMRCSTTCAQDVREQPAAAGLVDRRAGGLLRARQLAGELRRLVRLAGARCAHRRTPRCGARPRSS